MFKDVKALGQLGNGLFQTEQINFRKVSLMFHYTHRHVHRCITAALYQLLVSAQLKLEVCIKMQIGSLNVNEPCVFQPHQSQDYLPKSALLHYQSRHWHWSVEYQEKHCFSTNKNRVLKPALTLWIGCMSLPKILGWLVVAKQSNLWEGGSFGGLHPAGSAPPSNSCCECRSEDGVTESIEFNFRYGEGVSKR